MNLPEATRFAARLMLAALSGLAATVEAQDECHPRPTSNEAKLLAFYSVPVAFSTQRMPVPDGRRRPLVLLGADVAYVPKPDAALRVTAECFIPKDHTTHLSPVFPRPRVMIELPRGVLVEASYLPPLRIARATAHVFSAAAATGVVVTPPGVGPLVLGLRVHGTVGAIQGAITCSAAALRPDDPADPCFGSDPSTDTFHPNMFAAEGAVARRFGERGEIYFGGGTTWLRPRFQVGFRDGFGGYEDTRLLVNMTRLNVFGGGALRVGERWLVTGQVYSAPDDVTLGRVGLLWEGWTPGGARDE